MKISNAKAQDAAEKICKPLKDKIADYEKEIGKKVMEEYRKQIPKTVLDCFAKFPNFFQTESSIFIGRLDGRYVYARFEKSLPQLDNFVTDERKRNYVSYINHLETLTDNYNKSISEIKGAILALGTEKRISLEFPEAVPYLDIPKPQMALSINVKPVRKLACSLIPDCNQNKIAKNP